MKNLINRQVCYLEKSEILLRTKTRIFVLFNQVEEDHSGYVHLDKFLPAMTKVLLDSK